MRGASIVLIFIWSLAATVFSLEFGSWENVQYTRTVDLLKGYIKETALIQLKNIGDSPNNEYYLTLNDGIGEITKLSAFVTTLSEQPVVINAEEIEDHDENINAHLFKLTLPAPIAPGSTIEIRARYIYISGYEPLPARIEMHETQSLLIKLNKFAYSPYVTKAYSLIFTGVSKGQEMDVNYNTYGTDLTFTNPEELPAAEAFLPRVEGNTLVYGPTTQDLPPFSTQPMGLQYEHNLPLKHVYNLQRSIWIPASNADKVNVEEYYELTNKGASLTKGFLRVDWMKEDTNQPEITGPSHNSKSNYQIQLQKVSTTLTKLVSLTPKGLPRLLGFTTKIPNLW